MPCLTVINCVSGSARFPRAAVLTVLSRAGRLGSGRIKGQTVAAALVGKAESERLNKKYRGKNKAANVLSFTSSIEGELGDIVICYPLAVQEARELGEPIADRICYLFVHGWLHLLGFDHQTERQARSWERAEKKLLNIKIR